MRNPKTGQRLKADLDSLVQIGGELADEDRQCAWELYTELSTRVAVTGKSDDPDCGTLAENSTWKAWTPCMPSSENLVVS